MRYPEKELIGILKASGVDFTCSLPCEKIKVLLEMVQDEFTHIPLTREEEGVGICAGAALSGRRPAMFIQSSGIGNMINALLSLTGFYELPLAIFISQRGIYKEKIAAQFPMGKGLPKILEGSGIDHTLIRKREDFKGIKRKLDSIYKKGKIHAFLLSPALWENSEAISKGISVQSHERRTGMDSLPCTLHPVSRPALTRYELLEALAPFLSGKVVVCNLGFPAKEVFKIKHQPSNFYMLGSMGLATSIGLGIGLTTKKEVVVIDGDGSILMNPGSLATAAYSKPQNLTIIAIDNGAYGSTGSQPTLAGSCVDLELTAKGFGIRNTIKVSKKKQLADALKKHKRGLFFVHALAVPGNREVPNIPVTHLDIKKSVQRFLTEK
ncbi:MAG: sulfopyruvate decarboxylase subunit alpha [Nitrospirae bacterium]|nr:MAG: sulfopyruvate decarboxylase subunit alpha [Nitrospirota bacterium]